MGPKHATNERKYATENAFFHVMDPTIGHQDRAT